MTKRLFTGFAVPLGEPLREVIRRLRVSLDRQKIDVDWVAGSNLHVTLNFIGAVNSEQIPAIEEAMRQVARRMFTTELRGVGGFPDHHHARTLWLGVRNVTALAELQSRLDQSLRSLGFALETRSYIPYLTIGKIRKARSIADAISPFVRKEISEISVSEMVLYESLNHGGRPQYQTLAQVALG